MLGKLRALVLVGYHYLLTKTFDDCRENEMENASAKVPRTSKHLVRSNV